MDTNRVVTAMPRVRADAVSWAARNGAFALDPVTVEIGSGRLVAIIGPSGAGKTTLLELLAGVRVPTGGAVRGPAVVGFVPQDDIVHLQLPIARTLTYAARLRGETSPDVVDDVLATLGLGHRRDARLATVSGGERKRASIAVELLGNPAALFLDEPTSGLDPATGRELLAHLRGLATAGGTVVLTTHNPGDVALCDEVVVLAPDGKLAFVGTPAAALAHFGSDTAPPPAHRSWSRPSDRGPCASTRPKDRSTTASGPPESSVPSGTDNSGRSLALAGGLSTAGGWLPAGTGGLGQCAREAGRISAGQCFRTRLFGG